MAEMNMPSATALRQVYTAAYEAQHGTLWDGARALVDAPLSVEDTSLGITSDSLAEVERVLLNYASEASADLAYYEEATQAGINLGNAVLPNLNFRAFDLETAEAAMSFLSEALANDGDGVLLRHELDAAYAEAIDDPDAMVFVGTASDLGDVESGDFEFALPEANQPSAVELDIN